MFELGHAHLSDLPQRQLKKTLAERTEEIRVARREKAVLAVAVARVLPAFASERRSDLARCLLRREDERHVASEHPLEHGPDQRIVRAAEDDRVAARLLQRRGVLGDRV